MYDASGGPDLGVIISSYVVHEKINQATLILKRGEEIDDLSVGLIFGRRNWFWLGRFRFGAPGFNFSPSIDQDCHKQKNGNRQRGNQ